MLLDVRSQVDSKMTLLHEITDHVAKEYSHVRVKISAELSSISDAKNHTLSILLGELSELRKNITNTVEYLQEIPSAKDKFHVIMSPFLEKAKNEFDALEKKFQETQKIYHEVVAYFVEDPKLMDCDEFFGLIHRFVLNFEKAHKDLIRWKESEQKVLRQSKQDEILEAPIAPDSPGTKLGMIDEVLAELSSGRAYTPKATRTRQKIQKKRHKLTPGKRRHSKPGRSKSSEDLRKQQGISEDKITEEPEKQKATPRNQIKSSRKKEDPSPRKTVT